MNTIHDKKKTHKRNNSIGDDTKKYFKKTTCQRDKKKSGFVRSGWVFFKMDLAGCGCEQKWISLDGNGYF